MRFTPETSCVGQMQEYSEEQIRNETMIYGGSVAWTRVHGGPMTCDALRIAQENSRDLVRVHAERGYHPVIDTKSVLLMPGMSPCIPGWHCDGVIRSVRGAQPNLSTLDERVLHYIVTYDTVGGRDSTHYATSPIDVEVDESRIWASVNERVKDMQYGTYGNGEVVRMTRSTLHRGPPATVRQWRFFFRMSFYHMPCVNEIRNQVQVYTESKGW